MAAFGANGQVISVNDQVTIKGLVVSYTGSGGTALVTVETVLTPNTFVCQANDAQAVLHTADAAHSATSISGEYTGAAQDLISPLGRVTAISGRGNTALLTVTLKTSNLSIQVPAGACSSAQFNG